MNARCDCDLCRRNMGALALESIGMPVGEVRKAMIVAPTGPQSGVGFGLMDRDGEKMVVLALHALSGTTLFVELGEDAFDAFAQKLAVLGLAQMRPGDRALGAVN